MALTEKQRRFVEEYLIDLNATQAAIRAGYSARTARTTAAEYLAKPNIQAAVQKARQEQQKRTGITADFVLNELRKIAEGDASDDRDSSLRYTNKIRALELLGKHLGLFDEKKNDEGDGEGGIVCLASPEPLERPTDADIVIDEGGF